jgi:hypothetical protein
MEVPFSSFLFTRQNPRESIVRAKELRKIFTIPIESSEQLHDPLFPSAMATRRQLDGESSRRVIIAVNGETAPTIPV